MVLFPAFRLQDKMQKYTLGKRRWNVILRERKLIRDVLRYRRTHGGAMPPEPVTAKIKRCFGHRLGEDLDYSIDGEDELGEVTAIVSRSRSQLQEKSRRNRKS